MKASELKHGDFFSLTFDPMKDVIFLIRDDVEIIQDGELSVVSVGMCALVIPKDEEVVLRNEYKGKEVVVYKNDTNVNQKGISHETTE